MSKDITGYELSRKWFDYAFENPELISPNHAAIYFFAIEHCNRLGWKEKFGFPSQMAMDAIGISKHSTYIKYFKDLVEWGFFKLIQKSENQYSANIISLVSDKPKTGKALSKATINHGAKQYENQSEIIRSIDKPITNKPLTRNKIPPEYLEVGKYARRFIEEKHHKINDKELINIVDNFFNFYSANGWVRSTKGKPAPLKDWEAAFRMSLDWEKQQALISNGKIISKGYKTIEEAEEYEKIHGSPKF